MPVFAGRCTVCGQPAEHCERCLATGQLVCDGCVQGDGE